MQTILITGGAGFIGSHIANKLATDSYRIILFDNLSTGNKKVIPEKSIFVKGDVRNVTAVKGAINTYKPRIILHIAGQASNISSYTDPHLDMDVNYKGTINVVTASIKAKIPRFVYASSMLANNPTSYYGISKCAAERFCHATAIRPDLKSSFHVTSLRMFNVYGPGQSITNPYQGVLAIFIGNVLRGEPISIFGTGEQKRDFIFIDDVVTVWKNVIDKPASYGKVQDVGSGHPISINSLAREVIIACGKNPKTYPIRRLPKRPGDVMVVRASVKTKTIPFDQGLVRTVEWARTSSSNIRFES